MGERPGLDDPRSVFWDPDNVVVPDLAFKPWARPCKVCAFSDDDPQHLGADTMALLKTEVIDGTVDFYCVHRRTKSGCHRICAGADALARATTMDKEQGRGQ